MDPIDRSGPDGRGRRLARWISLQFPCPRTHGQLSRVPVGTDSGGGDHGGGKCHETAIWAIAAPRKQQDHDKEYTRIVFAQTANLEEHKLPIQHEQPIWKNS